MPWPTPRGFPATTPTGAHRGPVLAVRSHSSNLARSSHLHFVSSPTLDGDKAVVGIRPDGEEVGLVVRVERRLFVRLNRPARSTRPMSDFAAGLRRPGVCIPWPRPAWALTRGGSAGFAGLRRRPILRPALKPVWRRLRRAVWPELLAGGLRSADCPKAADVAIARPRESTTVKTRKPRRWLTMGIECIGLWTPNG